MSNATTVETSNAFAVLAEEEAHGDRQATEALLLTFNTDLGFFEARLLGMLRATGARVTVIGDAAVWNPDTRAVRHAGRSYHFGLVESRAAFHPKVLVLVGPKRAIAAVGSGNLTMGGWQYNRELLTVFTGNAEAMPAAFGDISRLLESLDEGGALDPLATAAVRRTVADLRALMAGSTLADTGHRVHASWDQALIDHLPTGPVEELSLFAAFHDPASSAVARLLDRLQPRRVTVAVQPGWTHLDPGTLDAALTRYTQRTGASWELVRDPTSHGEPRSRYCHGKLIEWVTLNGERHALTGSANLSQRALLTAVAAGGNHEVVVVGPIARPLFLSGIPITVGDVPTLLGDDQPAEPAETTSPTVRVTVARTREDAIEVHLNRAPAVTAVIEVSFHSDSPDHWTRLGDVEPGNQIKSFPMAVPAGSRIRAVTTDPATGLPSATAPVYVTDQARILGRVTTLDKRFSRVHRAVAADLFGDDIALLDSLQHDLANFARDLNNARQPTLSRETPDTDDETARTHGGDHAEPWLWLQDDTVHRYGAGLASWLLALPRLGNTGEGPEVPWVDIINEDTEVGLAEEDTDEATEQVLETGPAVEEYRVLDHDADGERLKAARRKWVSKAVAVAPEVPVLSRVFILRMALAFWSAGNWPDHDIEPFVGVRDLVDTLRVCDDRQPEELRERVAAATAVTLTVMRQRINPAAHDEQMLRYRQTADLATPLPGTLSEEVIDAYTTGLRTAHGGTLTPGHVIDTLAALRDPMVDLQAEMENRGYTVNRPAANHLHIYGTFSTPEQVALDAMGVAEEHDGIAIWASNHRDDWTLVAWRRPDLVTITQRGKAPLRWRHQRLRLMGPAAVATSLKRGGPGALPDVVLPKHRSTPAAVEVLASVGIDAPEPPQPR